MYYPRYILPYYTTPAQMEIILLHQTGPLVIDPRWRLLYYTRQAPSYVPQMEIPLIKHSANLPRWRFHYYTIQAPMNLPLMEITLLPPSLLIYCRWRLPYYTSLANLPRW